jgi:uncharacterized protein (DUF302 family)
MMGAAFRVGVKLTLWRQAMIPEGLVTAASRSGPGETMDRLKAEIAVRGMRVFACMDHAAGAAEVGSSPRPTALLIFGNAKAGTLLMQAVQAIGIDLPLKALVWQDEAGETWVSYNDPLWIAKRHGLNEKAEMAARAMAAALQAVTSAATGL